MFFDLLLVGVSSLVGFIVGVAAVLMWAGHPTTVPEREKQAHAGA